jgi:hypothetical protein
VHHGLVAAWPWLRCVGVSAAALCPHSRACFSTSMAPESCSLCGAQPVPKLVLIKLVGLLDLRLVLWMVGLHFSAGWWRSCSHLKPLHNLHLLASSTSQILAVPTASVYSYSCRVVCSCPWLYTRLGRMTHPWACCTSVLLSVHMCQ